MGDVMAFGVGPAPHILSLRVVCRYLATAPRR